MENSIDHLVFYKLDKIGNTGAKGSYQRQQAHVGDVSFVTSRTVHWFSRELAVYICYLLIQSMRLDMQVSVTFPVMFCPGCSAMYSSILDVECILQMVTSSTRRIRLDLRLCSITIESHTTDLFYQFLQKRKNVNGILWYSTLQEHQKIVTNATLSKCC